MTWTDIVRKLTSRRLWVAVAGIVTGVALALGGEASEVQSLAGTITALVSALGYMVTEASVDKARAKEGEGNA
jgi:drug/metabolite transporter (DMT)-like permease